MRNLLCKTCAAKFTLHPEDERDGWQMRKVPIVCKRPADLHITIIHAGGQERTEVPVLVCDTCNDELPDGTACVAVTMWKEGDEIEIGNWEKEYSQ